MEKCKDCGELTVKEDFENGRNVRVCIECGAIDKDAHDYVTSRSFEGTSFTDGQGKGPDGFKRSANIGPRKAEGLIFGSKTTKIFGQKLQFNESLITESINMYNMVFKKTPKGTSLEKRTAMIGACLYCTARQNGIAITLRKVAEVLDLKESGKKVRKQLNFLKKHFDIQPSTLNAKDEADLFLRSHNIPEDLKKLTHSIVALCERYWISVGRVRNITFTVATYFAWRACDISNNKLDFRHFCEKYSLECTRTCMDRKREVFKVLKATVDNIPWLAGQNKNDIYPYIKDALEFQSSLMPDIIEAAVECKKQSSSAESTKPAEQSNIAEETETAEQCSAYDETIFRKSRISTKRKIQDTEEIPTKSRKLDTCTDDDFDLGSDDDTYMYIRSEKEVQKIKAAYEKIEPTEK